MSLTIIGAGGNQAAAQQIYQQKSAVVLPYLKPEQYGNPQPRPISSGYNVASQPFDSNYQETSAYKGHPDVRIDQMGSFSATGFNPMTGVAKANVYGQEFDVPNAALSYLQAEDTFNQGRSDFVNQYFGLDRQRPEGMNYTDLGASQGMLKDWFAKNPQQAQSGYANPFQEYERKVRDAYAQYQAIPSNVNEVRDAQGNLISGGGGGKEAALAAYQDLVNNKPANYDTRGGRMSAQDQALNLQNSALKTRGLISPTFSNLPITESYQPKLP